VVLDLLFSVRKIHKLPALKRPRTTSESKTRSRFDEN
jgi:hypothetical protein